MRLSTDYALFFSSAGVLGVSHAFLSTVQFSVTLHNLILFVSYSLCILLIEVIKCYIR